MNIDSFKPGRTFSYGGIVPGLDPAIAWGAAASVKAVAVESKPAFPALVVTLTPTADHATTGNYNLTLFQSSVLTRDWKAALSLMFDIEFFNTAAPDPVLFTKTVTMNIEPSITWRPPS